MNNRWLSSIIPRFFQSETKSRSERYCLWMAGPRLIQLHNKIDFAHGDSQPFGDRFPT